MVKCLSAMQETGVRSLGWEDPLEKEMAAHSSTLAWKIPWTAEPGRLPSMGSQRVGHDWATPLSLLLIASYCFSSCITDCNPCVSTVCSEAMPYILWRILQCSSHFARKTVSVCMYVCFQSDLHIPLSQSIFSQAPFGFFRLLLFKVGELCLDHFHHTVIHVKPLITGLLIDFWSHESLSASVLL